MRTGVSFDSDDFTYTDERITGVFRIRAFKLPENRLAVVDIALCKGLPVPGLFDLKTVAGARDIECHFIKQDISLESQGLFKNYEVYISMG